MSAKLPWTIDSEKARAASIPIPSPASHNLSASTVDEISSLNTLSVPLSTQDFTRTRVSPVSVTLEPSILIRPWTSFAFATMPFTDVESSSLYVI